MTTADLHTLTGAYALDALDSDERVGFERHLRACEACSQEVRELTETAARLAGAVAVRPTPATKQEVLRRIATVRQEPPHTPAVERGADGAAGRGRRLQRFALAACVAAAVAFGGVAGWQHQRAEDAQEQAQDATRQSEQLAQVLAAPDARTTSAKLSDGADGTVVVSRSLDRAVYVASGMPSLPDGKVYQLWYKDGDAMRSAGVMPSRQGTESFLLAGDVGEATGVGVTIEPAGGSEQPTTEPLALMDISAA
ncbi:anti-sigma factor domain-containing protein [Streptomyces sp. NPDC060194]|uniref:anti-sigma factor n=1 Tax=Streptomyces sp. NPDC060194 TaxID=3347069 RepID=UPI0036515B03